MVFSRFGSQTAFEGVDDERSAKNEGSQEAPCAHESGAPVEEKHESRDADALAPEKEGVTRSDSTVQVPHLPTHPNNLRLSANNVEVRRQALG